MALPFANGGNYMQTIVYNFTVYKRLQTFVNGDVFMRLYANGCLHIQKVMFLQNHLQIVSKPTKTHLQIFPV